jgi:macrolide transport system ATP-binding/permease protein
VGVAEPGFHGSILALRLDVFVPLTMQPQLQRGPDRLRASDSRWLIPLGRLKPGASIATAAARTEVLAARLAADDPIGDVNERATVVPLWRSPFGGQTYLLPVVAVLSATGMLVLVLVCTNLANLALARSLTRRAELATRLALGASRSRITRLLILENVLLAIPAACAGLILSTRLFGLFGNAGAPAATAAPTEFDTSIDGLVIGFALVVSCASAVAFSLLAALRGSRVSLAAVIKEDAAAPGSAKARLRGSLVVAQVAASLLLLVAGGLALRTGEAACNADLGFDSTNVVSARIDLATSGYDDSRGRSFYERLVESLGARAGVESASVAEFVPLRMVEGRTRQVVVDGYEPRRDEDMRLAVNAVGPEYFRALHIDLVAGRAFTRNDTPMSPPVVIVNDTMARRFWQTPVDAVGHRIRVGDDHGEWRLVVGVARDIKYLRLSEGPTPYFYVPFAQDYRPEMTLHVRSAAGMADLPDRVREEVRRLDSNVPVLDIQTLADQARSGRVLYEVAAAALAAFGLIAIGLAAVGVYGLVSYAVRQSTHEIGVRIALGARRGDVVLRFLTRGMWLGLLGAAIGIGAALMTTRLMVAVLYGVNAMDPVAFVGAAGVVLGITLFASLVPSWRAASTDPIRALRHS